MECPVARSLKLGTDSGALTVSGGEPHDETKRDHERDHGHNQSSHEHDSRKEFDDHQ